MNALKQLVSLSAAASPDQTDARSQFRQHVADGLSLDPKQLSSMYFYDAAGSRLFQQIMDLPEYYLTRSEFSILQEQRSQIARELQKSGFFHLIDLGAGDALKTRILLEQLSRDEADFEYIPVDISGDAMEGLLETLDKELPEVAVQAVASDYFTALNWLHQEKTSPKVVLFLGSNIGNFEKQEALEFLQRIRHFLQPGDKLLVGFDLRKDPLTIRQAYDDAQGVTAAFNMNLLKRINTELGADFDLGQFKHYCSYNPVAGVMKSYLISTTDQTVTLGNSGKKISFKAWEAIHTENSFKYDLGEIKKMAETCNFEVQTFYTDKAGNFADVLLSVT